MAEPINQNNQVNTEMLNRLGFSAEINAQIQSIFDKGVPTLTILPNGQVIEGSDQRGIILHNFFRPDIMPPDPSVMESLQANVTGQREEIGSPIFDVFREVARLYTQWLAEQRRSQIQEIIDQAVVQSESLKKQAKIIKEKAMREFAAGMTQGVMGAAAGAASFYGGARAMKMSKPKGTGRGTGTEGPDPTFKNLQQSKGDLEVARGEHQAATNELSRLEAKQTKITRDLETEKAKKNPDQSKISRLESEKILTQHQIDKQKQDVNAKKGILQEKAKLHEQNKHDFAQAQQASHEAMTNLDAYLMKWRGISMALQSMGSIASSFGTLTAGAKAAEQKQEEAEEKRLQAIYQVIIENLKNTDSVMHAALQVIDAVDRGWYETSQAIYRNA